MSEMNELIPELKLWNNGRGIDVDSWTNTFARYDHFIGYARIVWPEFVEHDGCIFLAEGFIPENYRQWRKTLGNKACEAMINHRHIADIFSNSTIEPTRELILHIGRLLKETWSTKLKTEFPDRAIVVSFPESFSKDLVDYEISFFQEEH